MTIAVLIHEEEDKLEEINLDIDPVKNEIYKILSGRATFIGQWPDIDVVILKCVQATKLNQNTLPPPFHGEEVYGKILLVRMDEDSEPRDFTLKEFTSLG
jgi:hypothetical protein|tara:strand:- start:3888 stop:4187 length:300 start_codon:yes stop_codon:yes gene_type:complete